jgi:hypothetical protein
MEPETSIRRLADCPAGKIPYLEGELRERFRDWLTAHGPLAVISDNEVRLFKDFGLRRDADGRLVLFEQIDIDTHHEVPDCLLSELGQRAVEAANMRLRLLLLDKLRQFTGRDYRMLDLARIVPYTLSPEPFRSICMPYEDALQKAALALRGMLDKQVAKLCAKAMPGRATLTLYNAMVRNRACWDEILESAPGLLPVAAHAIERHWLPPDGMVLQQLKVAVLREGYAARDWRMLARLPLSHTRWIMEQHGLEACLKMAQHWAWVNAGIPPADLFRRSAETCLALYRKLTIPDWFDRAALTEYPARQAANTDKPFLRREYVDALDWLRTYLEAGGQPDKQQRRAGWHWIDRQSAAWHEEAVRMAARMEEARSHPGDHWESLVTAYGDGEYEIVPLLTRAELAAEGRRMHNCVGSYDLPCYAGYTRIFSIRQAGKPLATAELTYCWDRRWRLGQVRGPCNTGAPAAILAVAQRLAARYTGESLAQKTT